jgi:hypothetical protein
MTAVERRYWDVRSTWARGGCIASSILLMKVIGSGPGAPFGGEMSLVGDVGIQHKEDPNVRLAKLKIVCFSCLPLTGLILRQNDEYPYDASEGVCRIKAWVSGEEESWE